MKRAAQDLEVVVEEETTADRPRDLLVAPEGSRQALLTRIWPTPLNRMGKRSNKPNRTVAPNLRAEREWRDPRSRQRAAEGGPR